MMEKKNRVTPDSIGTLTISKEMKLKLKMKCVELGITMKRFIEQAIIEKIERSGGK